MGHNKPDPAAVAAQVQGALAAAALAQPDVVAATDLQDKFARTQARNKAQTHQIGTLQVAASGLQGTIDSQSAALAAAPGQQRVAGLAILLGAAGGYLLGQVVGRPGIGLAVGGAGAWWWANRPPTPPAPADAPTPDGLEVLPPGF